MAILAMKDIIRKYPNTKLSRLREWTRKRNVEELIINQHLENNISMLGHVTNLQEYQKISDIRATRNREGLPIKCCLEAMLAENTCCSH